MPRCSARPSEDKKKERKAFIDTSLSLERCIDECFFDAVGHVCMSVLTSFPISYKQPARVNPLGQLLIIVFSIMYEEIITYPGMRAPMDAPATVFCISGPRYIWLCESNQSGKRRHDIFC